MCQCQKVFKYGPHLTSFLLLICFIFNCITISCTEDGLIWTQIYVDDLYYPYTTWGSLGWQSEYSWTTEQCSSSGLALGALSIICLLISIATNAILIYFIIIQKNTNKLHMGGGQALKQRHIIIIISVMMFVLLLPASAAYFANCSDALWTVDYYTNWGPDYGLIVVWVTCVFLIAIMCLNIVPWTKEIDDKSKQKQQTNVNVPSSQITSDNVVVIAQTQLPYGWSQHVTSDGKIFYQDDVNKRTQWLRPTEEAILNGWSKYVTSYGKTYYSNALLKTTQWERPTKLVKEEEGTNFEPDDETVPLSSKPTETVIR